MIYINLLKGLDQNWSAKQKARFIYWNLCKNIVYDERFMYGTNQSVLKSIYYRNVDINKDESPEVVCNSANKIYLQLLEMAGVKAKLIHKKSSIKRPIEVPDVALVFWDEAGNKYYTNIVGDIENCRFGSKTSFFGIRKNLYNEAQDVKEITAEELRDIDYQVGNIKRDYLDIFFEYIKEEVKNTNHFKKFLNSVGVDTTNMDREEILRNKMMYLTRLVKYTDKTASSCERKEFYKKLFCGSVLDRFESKAFTAYEFFKESEVGEVDSKSVLEINMLNRPVYYVYDAQEQTYVQVAIDQLADTIEGYTEARGKVPFVISQIRSAVPKVRDEQI